jgi:hypothetical protein
MEATARNGRSDWMSRTNYNHWGQWLMERSLFVGFRRHSDLAEQIGCTREYVSRLASKAAPPSRMFKGFDRSLARALRTTYEAVFKDWYATDPAIVPTVIYSPTDSSAKDTEFSREEVTRATCHELLRNIRGQLLERAKEALIGLAAAQLKTDKAQDMIRATTFRNELKHSPKMTQKTHRNIAELKDAIRAKDFDGMHSAARKMNQGKSTRNP